MTQAVCSRSVLKEGVSYTRARRRWVRTNGKNNIAIKISSDLRDVEVILLITLLAGSDVPKLNTT